MGIPSLWEPGSKTHFVWPVTGSMAATCDSDVLVYSTPLIMMGVPWWTALGAIPAFAARTAWSGDIQRQAILREATFAASI